MWVLRAAALVVVKVALYGCATVGYQPYDAETGVGYSEHRIGKRLFFIEYVADRDRADAAAVKRLVLRRCAEVAVENGTRYFEIREGRKGFGNSLYRHSQSGDIACYGTGLGYHAMTRCHVREGQTYYEQRRDRIRYRAQCHLANEVTAGHSIDAEQHLQRIGVR